MAPAAGSPSPPSATAGISGRGGGYVGVLDPLRGLAALAVALFHFTNNGWLPKDHWLARFGFFGHHGVETFLVLSGFVVPYAMWRGGYTVRSVGPFLGRRLTRIYPPYLASVLIFGASSVMGFAAGSERLGIAGFLSHLLLLNDLLGLPWLLTVYWTLALEVQFYLLAGLAWRVLASRRSWVFGLFAVACAAAQNAWPGPWLVGTIGYFLLGIALFRQHASLDKPIASALFLVALSAMIWHFHGWVPLAAASLPMVAKFAIHHVPTAGQFLGKISYSLYLVHLLVGASFLVVLTPYVTSLFWRVTLVPVALALSLAAAWIAYRLLEAPAIAWSKRFRYHGKPLGGPSPVSSP